jgi:hypothetical protein
VRQRSIALITLSWPALLVPGLGHVALKDAMTGLGPAQL